MTSEVARDEGERNAGEALILDAVLQPRRSLAPAGFVLLMSLVAGVSFAGGVFFYHLGAWPVTGFFGLDLSLIYLAFRANYRAARAHETVQVARNLLLIRRVPVKGAATEIRLNPYWARLHVERDDEGVVRRLSLTSHGRRHELAANLGPNERERFAEALAAALSAARAG
jgi:uncharacterized membrane protein